MHHHPLRRSGEDPLEFLERVAATGHDLVPCRIGRRAAFLVNHPRLIEEVLVRQAGAFVKGRGYLRASRLLGDGLLTASGPRHAARRRLLQPIFHPSHVTAYAATMIDTAVRLRDRWMAGTPLDVACEMQELTLTIAGVTLLGGDLAACAAEVRAAVASAMSPMDGLLSAIAPPSRVRRARRALESLVNGLIARRLQSSAPHDDLLGLLLASAADGDRQQVRDEAITFLLAGHDTLAHALTWTWILLADHPDIERQMAAELGAVLGDRLPSADDLPALRCTRGVLAEALRLRPPAWVIVREAAEARDLGGTEVPGGALVIVSPWVTHRDARFFTDPLTFDPSRWASPAAAERPKLAYLPFGAGGRSCIGEHFAWMEGTLVLATIAQRWRLTHSDPGRVGRCPRITLRPAGPVTMIPFRPFACRPGSLGH